MDVFYINLLSVLNAKQHFQSIYLEFDVISKLFSTDITDDIHEHDLSLKDMQTSSNLIEASDQKYRVLSLLLLLARWKKLLNLKDPIHWFHRYKQVSRVIIPKLTINEFEAKCDGKYIHI